MMAEVVPPDFVAVRSDKHPPILHRLDEVWGLRCACALQSLPHLFSASCARARRYVNIDQHKQDSELRRNALGRDIHPEYCVHGHWLTSKTDANGLPGTWWVPLRLLVKQLGREDTNMLVEHFEDAQKSERQSYVACVSSDSDEDEVDPVSYTHLTLPTICSV